MVFVVDDRLGLRGLRARPVVRRGGQVLVGDKLLFSFLGNVGNFGLESRGEVKKIPAY